jgi:thiamine-phosphate pyrophosphorylase
MPAVEPCRLYLITPAAFDPNSFADDLAAVLDAGDVACVRLALDGGDDDFRRACESLVPVCRDRDVAFLLSGTSHLVDDTGADGIHAQGFIEGLRAALPAGAILGAGCGLSRHDALVAGEMEADYVSFGPMGCELAEIVAWWNQMVVLPCVAEGIADVAQAAQAVEAGADFLAPGATIWDHGDGPAKAVAAFDAVIAKNRGR